MFAPAAVRAALRPDEKTFHGCPGFGASYQQQFVMAKRRTKIPKVVGAYCELGWHLRSVRLTIWSRPGLAALGYGKSPDQKENRCTEIHVYKDHQVIAQRLSISFLTIICLVPRHWPAGLRVL